LIIVPFSSSGRVRNAPLPFPGRPVDLIAGAGEQGQLGVVPLEPLFEDEGTANMNTKQQER